MLIGYTVLGRDGSVLAQMRGNTEPGGKDGAPAGNGRGEAGADGRGEVAALEALGCEKVFTDSDATRRGERANFRAALDFLRPGDVLVVPALSHLGQDVESVVLLVERLRRAGVGVRIGDSIVPGMPTGEAFVVACRELAQLVEPPVEVGVQSAGPARRRGRPQALSGKDLAKARRLLAESTMTVSDVARALGVSPATVYRYFPRRAPKSMQSGDNVG